MINKSKTSKKNRNILIVDDEPSLMSALVDVFIRADFEVNVAENGEQGLISALKNKPDIILLDIIMPIMDGLTMLEKLRQDPWGKHAKVILLTNLSDPAEGSTKIATKVKDYIIKSDWKIEDVVNLVKKRLG